MLGISRSGVQKVMMNACYKKQPLIIRQSTEKKGKPAYFVLWDIETNQPAQPGEDDDQPETTPCDNLVPTVASAYNSRPTSLSARSEPRADLNPAHAQADAGHHGDGVDSRPSVPITDPSLLLQTQTATVLSFKNMAVDGSEPSSSKPQATKVQEGICVDSETGEVVPTPNNSITLEDGRLIDTDTGEIINGQLDPLTIDDFETLLHRKLQGKDKDKQRTLRHYYRKKYAESGVIPEALEDRHSIRDGRIVAGRKSQLDPAIAQRFIDMVKCSNDKSDPKNYHTAAHCKVTIFHRELEYELKQTIPIQSLYTLVRKHGLSPYFERIDDNETPAKAPKFILSVPVGESLLLDGVGADYFTVNRDGKPFYPWWINFMDYGSRRIQAIHAYYSESNEASVDILNRYLIENRHAHAVVKMRPDNAKGFLNLKRCITEINQRKKARPGGFTMIDDFSRVGTPVDKAALESSHRALHDFERYIINRFKDRITGQSQKQKKFGNGFRTITVTHLDITLEELNASGVIQEYQRQHNNLPHKPTVNGKQTTWILDDAGEPVLDNDGKKMKWIPEPIWQRHLADNETFTFDEADLEANRIYGYTKHKGTITKQGYVQYKTEKYFVSNRSLYSRVRGTEIQYSIIGGGKIALFNAQQDGVYLGEAICLQAPVKPQKIIDMEQKKIDKAVGKSLYRNIVDQFAPFEMFFNEDEINNLINQGLTEAITQAVLAIPKVYLQENKIKQYNFFKAEAKELIGQAKGPKAVNGITR